MIKFGFSLLLAGVFCLILLNTHVFAVTAAAMQNLTIAVSPIAIITISGSPKPFIVAPLKPNSPVLVATDATTSYAVTTNMSNLNIWGSIDANFPPGVSLEVGLLPPTGAASTGSHVLSMTQQLLVEHMGPIAQANLTITYTLTVQPTASLKNMGDVSRQLTLTISP